MKNPRLIGLWLRRLGTVLATLGALAIIGGALLPWAQFPLFGTTVALPGVVIGGGATLAVGLLALPFGRRVPLLGVVLGVTALVLGLAARRDAPKAVSRETLALRVRLAPINARLEAIRLPPIEPFGASFGQRASFLGAGPAWIIGGGALLLLGSALLPFADRLRRACRGCGTRWPESRLETIHYCPVCGRKDDDSALCRRCGGVLEPNDKFCVRCGETA